MAGLPFQSLVQRLMTMTALAAMLAASTAFAATYNWQFYPAGHERVQRQLKGDTAYGIGSSDFDCGWKVYGWCVVWSGGTDWMRYDSVDTKGGLCEFGVLTRSSSTTGKMLLHLDSLNGQVLCTLSMRNTGGVLDTIKAPIVPPFAGGVRTLYANFLGAGNSPYAAIHFYTCGDGKASTPVNWVEKALPSNGDTVIMNSTCGNLCRDTSYWDLPIAPSVLSFRSSGRILDFRPLSTAGVSSFTVDSLDLNAAAMLPAGFILQARRAATIRGAAKAVGSYTASTIGCMGLSPCILGEGSIVVGDPAAVSRARWSGSASGLRRTGAWVIGERVARFNVYDMRGNLIRSIESATTISLDGVSAGHYIVQYLRPGNAAESMRFVIGE